MSSSKKELPQIIRKKEKYNLNKEDLPIVPLGSIKYELNLIEFPIFSKDKKISENVEITYTFSEKEDEHLTITPGNESENICNKILQEFDEKIFYALMRIYEETRKRKIVSDYSSLIKIADMKYTTQSLYRAKDSLQRMESCSIKFNKAFYDAKSKKDGLNYIKQTKKLNLLSSLETLTFEKYKNKGIEKNEEDYKKYFNRHKNIKEIFIATLNDDIIENIENHSHKYFKTQDLLALKNSTVRKLYIMLTKWRHWEKKNKIRRTSKFLASRIPLSWTKSNIPGSVRSLEKACEELKRTGKISDYNINRENGLENSSIDFIFRKVNEDIAIEELNKLIGIEETGHEKIEIVKEEKKEFMEQLKLMDEEEKIYSIEVLELFNLLPKVDRIELRKDSFEELLKKHSFDMLKSDLNYCSKKNTDDFFAYFLKSTNSGHYSLAEIEKQKKIDELKEEKEQKKEEEKEDKLKIKKEINKKATERYSKLEEEEIDEYKKKYDRQKKFLDNAGVDFEGFVLNEIIYELENK